MIMHKERMRRIEEISEKLADFIRTEIMSKYNITQATALEYCRRASYVVKYVLDDDKLKCIRCGCPCLKTSTHTPINPEKPDCVCDCHIEKARSCRVT